MTDADDLCANVGTCSLPFHATPVVLLRALDMPSILGGKRSANACADQQRTALTVGATRDGLEVHDPRSLFRSKAEQFALLAPIVADGSTPLSHCASTRASAREVLAAMLAN